LYTSFIGEGDESFLNEGPGSLLRGYDHKNRVGLFKNLLKNHRVRKDEIDMEAF
jgi:hypothetical protein